jgi:hypothetical protein
LWLYGPIIHLIDLPSTTPDQKKGEEKEKKEEKREKKEKKGKKKELCVKTAP